MTIELIYIGAERFINQLIIDEFHAQGHTLTGEFEKSLSGKTDKTKYTATHTVKGLKYGMIVNEGLQPSQIKDSMLPGLVNYFLLRGFSQKEAPGLALATLRKWKQEGMSTQASKRFSSTGGRQHFIEAAFLNPAIDDYMLNTIDFGIDQEFLKTKNETI